MGTIKINKEKLIEYCQTTAALKEYIDKILVQTDNTEEVLNGVKVVNAWTTKSELQNTQDLAYNISVILGKLTEDFYNAANQFDYEESKLNGLVGIQRDVWFNPLSKDNKVNLKQGSVDFGKSLSFLQILEESKKQVGNVKQKVKDLKNLAVRHMDFQVIRVLMQNLEISVKC